MGKQFRYPGAQPFQKKQQNLFFGREDDIEGLYELLTLERLVVVYSKSGLGKSSLINAGILPRLEENKVYKPISIRFGAHRPDKPTPLEVARQIIAHTESIHPLLDKTFKNDLSLWFYLKNRQLNHNISNFILIIDQFEELFTYPEEEIIAFKKQLSDLLNTEMPNNFRDMIAALFDGNGQARLSDDELELLHRPVEVKILLAIRSDRMSLLNNLSDYLPNVLRICYELKPLNIAQAEEAILSPAFLSDERFLSPTFDYEDEVIESILDFLTKGRSESVESFQLQILCQSLERKVIDQGLTIIRPPDLGNMGAVYENYYDSQIARLDTMEEQIAARKLIEEALIFEEEERRLSLYEGQIFQSFGFSPELLRKLVDVHLLRAEPSLKGGYTYEIPHDTLVPPILKAKKKRLGEERKIAEEKARQEQERKMAELRREADEERRKRMRARLAAIVSTILAIMAFASMLYAINQSRKANAAEQLAQEEKERTLALSDSLALQLFNRVEADYERLLAEGRRLAAEGDFSESLDAYAQALTSIRGFGNRIDQGGEKAQREQKEVQQQAEKFGNFTQLMKDGDAFVVKGESYYRQALAKYQQARSLNYNSTLNQAAQNKIEQTQIDIREAFGRYKNRGMLYVKRQDYGQACQNLKIAKSLVPDDNEVNDALNQHCQ